MISTHKPALKYIFTAFFIAVFLYNKTLYLSLKFQTLYKLFYGLKLNYNNVKTQGSLIYYFNNKPGKLKLLSKKRNAILIKYRENNYIYKVWDIEFRKALFLRDVVILENIFRFNEDNYTIPECVRSIDCIKIGGRAEPYIYYIIVGLVGLARSSGSGCF